MSKRKIADTTSDATLPRTHATVGGKTYDLCFDLGALSEAETQLCRQGHEVNLLNALPVQNLANTRIVFAAAVRKFHPELEFEEAQALLGLGDLYSVALLIQEAWNKATADPNAPKVPPQPGE
jgi:hypothetical protein